MSVVAVRTVLAVTLLAFGCTSAAPTAPAGVALDPLEGTAWLAEDIDGGGVAVGVRSTLLFDAGQKVAGRAACNRYFGTYQQSGDMVEIKPGGTTRMACPPAVMDQEDRFLAVLGAVRTARREGDKLVLLDSGGRVRMRLTPIARQSAEMFSPLVPCPPDRRSTSRIIPVPFWRECSDDLESSSPSTEPGQLQGASRLTLPIQALVNDVFDHPAAIL